MAHTWFLGSQIPESVKLVNPESTFQTQPAPSQDRHSHCSYWDIYPVLNPTFPLCPAGLISRQKCQLHPSPAAPRLRQSAHWWKHKTATLLYFHPSLTQKHWSSVHVNALISTSIQLSIEVWLGSEREKLTGNFLSFHRIRSEYWELKGNHLPTTVHYYTQG